MSRPVSRGAARHAIDPATFTTVRIVAAAADDS